MIRLRRDDFDDAHELAKFAATAGMSLQQFREEFAPLIESEPPPLQVAVPNHPNPSGTAAPPAVPPDALGEPPPTVAVVGGEPTLLDSPAEAPSGKGKKK